jgi:hypothetical protein
MQIKMARATVLYKIKMEWHSISDAPFDRDLELAVIAKMGYMLSCFRAAVFSADGSNQRLASEYIFAPRIGGNGLQRADSAFALQAGSSTRLISLPLRQAA